MALVVKDRVKETTTTAGTGTITLAGAVSGYQSFSVIGNGNTTYYTIVDSANGTWEVGIGTYTASGTTLSRDTILESSSGGSAVSFAAGTKDVFVTYPAERAVYVDNTSVVIPNSATIANNQLANSTISGKALGSNLDTLTLGTYLTGTSYNGSAAVTAAVDATSANTASKVVARDGSGNFSAGTITASLTGTASTATNIAAGAQGSIPYQSAAGTTAFLTKDTNATRYLANTGTTNNPAWAQIDLSNGVTGTLPAANGGTGNASYTIGDLLYASGTTALSKLAGVATGNALISGGIATAPSWGKIGLTTHISGTLAIANGGTGNTTIAARSVFVANTADTLTTVTPTAGQSIRINAGNTAWEAYTPGTGDVTLAGTNIFTGTNTFRNVAGIRVEAASTQDAIIVDGRSGGTSSYAITVIPTTLASSTTLTLPNVNDTVATIGTAQTFTAAQTFRAANSIRAEAAATQDAIVLAGRAGGTSSYAITLTPATLAASRTLTLPEPGANVTLGYLNIPQNSQSAAYTLVATDAGKHILHPSADTTARTFTIPANSSVPYEIGTAITFINQNGAGVVTIAITSDTMRLAGAGTTGSRTLAANGVATAVKITSTEWIISGTGLT